MFDLQEELKTLLELLEANNLDYALCGGLAMSVHGRPRATEDIDFLVRRESIPVIVDLVRERGFEFRANPMRFKGGATEIYRLSKISREDTLMLDLLAVTEPLEDVWASRIRVQWQFGQLWVVSRQGLEKMKLISGRAKDLWDIEQLKELDHESD